MAYDEMLHEQTASIASSQTCATFLVAARRMSEGLVRRGRLDSPTETITPHEKQKQINRFWI